ncbi:beta-phosphoglucomutase [Pedobacter sp. SAFR-022]|uniref:beta-phosphoglucomutase n=1 Tax=Pedobacter sp. SAFR-022 TaxID=3436861 RepID=UPI003F7EA2BE
MNINTDKIGCLFDLDGVLVDTAVYHYKAWKALANRLGFDFTEAQNEHLKGVNRMRSLEMILDWGKVSKTEAEMLELASGKNAEYVEMISKMTAEEVLPGTPQLLEQLKAAGIKIALGSASKNSGMILERTNLAHYFDAIIDGNHVNASKPDPEVFLKGAEALGLEPANCIVFEDAQAGVQAALNGGMKVIGIGQQNNLQGANMVIKDLSEISVSQIIDLVNDKA